MRAAVVGDRGKHPSQRSRVDPKLTQKLGQQFGKLGWFSPLSDDSAGLHGWSPAAYTTKILAPFLVDHFQCTFFHERFTTPAWCEALTARGLQTQHFLTAGLHWSDFDLFLYQLEDHRRTAFSRMHLGVVPGVVWFHDFLLTDDGPEPILNSPWERTFKIAETVAAARAEPGSIIASQLPWAHPEDEFTRPRPYAVREAQIGGLPIFSSERDRDEYVRLNLGSLLGAESGRSVERSGLVPIPVDPGLFDGTVRGKGGGPRVVAWCGAPGMERRSAVIAEAFGRIAGSDAPTVKGIWMLTSESDRALANDMLLEFGAQDLVELRVGKSYDDWIALLSQVDLALHLHFSAYGHAGPALALSLATGTPVVVSDFGESDYLPDGAVLKVQPGIAEVGELFHILRTISDLPLSTLGARARVIAQERHHAGVVAAQLRSLLEQHRSELSDMQSRWKEVERCAREALGQMIRGIGWSQRPWYEDHESQWLDSAATELGWGESSWR